MRKPRFTPSMIMTTTALCAFVISILTIFSLILLPTIPKSYAHASMISSTPSPFQSLPSAPSKVDVQFSEPVDLHYSKLTVLDENGKQVDNKDVQYVNSDETLLSVTLPPGLSDGAYTVNSRVLSAVDGHVTEDAFLFAVGEAALPQTSTLPTISKSVLYIPDAIARFPTLVGQVMVVGAAFAMLWLWRPISKITWLKESIAQTRRQIDLSFVNLAVIGSVILVASDFGIIYVQAMSINAGIVDAISTKFGNVWVLRTALSFILLASTVYMRSWLRRESSRSATRSTRRDILRGFTTALFAVGLMVVATTSLIGHGAANAQILPITIDFIHNTAAAIWIGGIIFIAFVLMPRLRRSSIDDYAKISTISILIPRFSTIVVTILGVIVVTGPALLYILESDLGLTLASVYGKVLIVKLSLAGVMIAFGAYNQMVIHRRALKVTDALAVSSIKGNKRSGGGGDSSFSHPSDIRSVFSRFNSSTKSESFVGIALLAAVAVLVNTGLPSNEFQSQLQQQNALSVINSTTAAAVDQGFIATRFVEDGNDRMILSVDPFAVGNNNFKISLLDSDKNPLDIKSVQMKFTQIDKGIGPVKVDTKQVSKGVFSSQAAFSLPGRWNVEVQAEQNKSNAPSIVSTYDLFVKPQLNQLAFNVQEFKTPDNKSLPLYPVYDSSRDVIWAGDTAPGSGRVLEFSLNSSKYAEHKVNGTSIITGVVLDSSNKLWYVDPITKNIGQYDPSGDGSNNQLIKLPDERIVPSAIAIDPNDNLWITSPNTNEILRFDSQARNFTSFKPPTEDAKPGGITIDRSGQIWVAEGIGKLANLDPSKNYNVTEYAPRMDQNNNNNNNTLVDPTALLADPLTDDIYISQHEGHAISVFSPALKTFKQYPLNPNGLPFGMTLDGYGNLWVAEHTINRIAVLDPRTGSSKEITIPTKGPFIQWLTSDSKGNVWFAEQRGNSIGSILITAKSAVSPLLQNNGSGNQTASAADSNGNNAAVGDELGTFKIGLRYSDLIFPAVAVGIVVSAFFYSKSIIDLKRSTNYIDRRK